MAEKQILGLKKMRVSGATRRDEWNRPNAKAAARLEARIKDYEKSGKTPSDGFNRPGSMKIG